MITKAGLLVHMPRCITYPNQIVMLCVRHYNGSLSRKLTSETASTMVMRWVRAEGKVIRIFGVYLAWREEGGNQMNACSHVGRCLQRMDDQLGVCPISK